MIVAAGRARHRRGAPLQARVGIATGLVVVGDLIGQGASQEQAVVGGTPNLAARLQALAEPGAVVIAPSTRRLTGGLFEYVDLSAGELKDLVPPVPQETFSGITRARPIHSSPLVSGAAAPPEGCGLR